jgi:hypothetical protein
MFEMFSKKSGKVAHACNPSTWEDKTGGSRVWGKPGLHSKFNANLSYIMRPCFKTKQKKSKDQGTAQW